MTADTRRARIALDREFVRRGGFYQFVRLAWDHIPYNANTPFVPAWHIEEMCVHAEAFTIGSRLNPDSEAPPIIREFVCNVPPGYTKSMVFSVLHQAWVWTFKPDYRVMWASYADQLARDNATHLRGLLQSTWYRERWGDVLADSRKLKYLTTRAGGFRFSTTIGGQAIGKHCHAFGCDDPVKPPKENSLVAGDMTRELENANSWLKNVFSSRALKQSQYVKFMVMQRLAENDPAGIMIRNGAVNLRLPALFDEREPCLTPIGGDRRSGLDLPRVTSVDDPRVLNPGRFSLADENARAAGMGGWEGPIASAQLQQSPAPPGGLIFKKDTFRRFKASDFPIAKVFSVLSVDCNFKKNPVNSDVGITIEGIDGQGRIFTYHWESNTMGWVETRARLLDLVRQWRPNGILIEDKANGPAMIDELKNVYHLGNVIAIDPKTTKESRAHAANVSYQAQNVYHNSESLGSGNLGGVDDFEGALAKFPRGLKKDVIDAHSMAVMYLAMQGAANPAAVYGKLGGPSGGLTGAFARHFKIG